MSDSFDGIDLRPALRKVGAGPNRARDLTLEEATETAHHIMSGSAPPAQVGALLIAMRVKEEAPEEIAGFALAVRALSTPVTGLPLGPIVDCAGAYDGRVRTVPLGTAGALVAARAGVVSLFHGVQGLGRGGINPGQMLSALTANEPVAAVRYVDQEQYCPALAALRPLRNSLGLRTVFNTAEKLVDLAGDRAPDRTLLIGIFHGGYLDRVARTAQLCGFSRALVVQGLEGSEDLSPARDTKLCELRDGVITNWTVDLEGLDIIRCPASDLESKGVDESVMRIQAALSGEPGPVRDGILLNAGIRLYLAGMVTDLGTGVARARALLA